MNRYAQRVKELTEGFIGHIDLRETISVSEAELDKAEQEIGYPLPADYREFLRNYGELYVITGILIPDAKPGEPQWSCGISTFYGVNAKHQGKDLVKTHHSLSYLTPPGLLRIGDADHGFVALSLTGEQRGSIFWVSWPNHLHEPEDISLVAHSFDEFIHLLEPRSS